MSILDSYCKDIENQTDMDESVLTVLSDPYISDMINDYKRTGEHAPRRLGITAEQKQKRLENIICYSLSFVSIVSYIIICIWAYNK